MKLNEQHKTSGVATNYFDKYWISVILCHILYNDN